MILDPLVTHCKERLIKPYVFAVPVFHIYSLNGHSIKLQVFPTVSYPSHPLSLTRSRLTNQVCHQILLRFLETLDRLKPRNPS
jgi:hypothetical protein